MAKYIPNTISSGFASNDLLNDEFTKIQTALENTLSRDGSTPNSMSADLDMNGNAFLNVKASSGNENFLWMGSWTTTTAYVLNNLVYVPLSESSSNGGSTYIVTTDHTAGATFDGDISNFDLFALQGEDGSPGAGTGDMVGPSGAVDANIAVYDGTTGKLLEDSGSSVSDFATSTHNHDADYADISHEHVGTDITSGTVAAARLGSGTPDGTKFLRDDNSWQDLPSSTPSTSDVLTATAGASVGAVGTYAMLIRLIGGGSTAAGATVAGSSLRYANAYGGYSTSVSGTWRCMGYAYTGSYNAQQTSLWLRIS